MSYPTWRVESWYEENRMIGFRVTKHTATGLKIAENGNFRIDAADPYSKPAMREAAIQLRDQLTKNESDPRVLAAECRSILRDILHSGKISELKPTEITVASVPLTNWLKDRIDRLCSVLNVKDDF
jgi:hypothetical protein